MVSWSSCLVSGVFSVLDRAQHPRDVADLGRHPGRRHDHLPAPPRHLRVHVGHVDAVTQRDVVTDHGLDALRHGRALTGEARLLDLERGDHEHAAVGRHLVARLEPDDVTRNEILGRDLLDETVALDVGRHDQHLLQSFDAFGRLALLVQAHQRVEDRQGDEHHTRSTSPGCRPPLPRPCPGAPVASGPRTAARTPSTPVPWPRRRACWRRTSRGALRPRPRSGRRPDPHRASDRSRPASWRTTRPVSAGLPLLLSSSTFPVGRPRSRQDSSGALIDPGLRVR